MRPKDKIIVFDGVCVLCTAWFRFVLHHDRSGYCRFATMQSAAGRHLLQQHGIDPDDPVSFLVVCAGHALRDTQAIIAVVSDFGGCWRLIGMLKVVPARVRDTIYRWIARNRYRWFGRHPECVVPDAAAKHRCVETCDELARAGYR